MLGPVTGIIFDMDGTLTMPGALDFQAMYTRTGNFYDYFLHFFLMGWAALSVLRIDFAAPLIVIYSSKHHHYHYHH
jgi:hypothetical protein